MGLSTMIASAPLTDNNSIQPLKQDTHDDHDDDLNG